MKKPEEIVKIVRKVQDDIDKLTYKRGITNGHHFIECLFASSYGEDYLIVKFLGFNILNSIVDDIDDDHFDLEKHLREQINIYINEISTIKL